jgi:hypothetical protein
MSNKRRFRIVIIIVLFFTATQLISDVLNVSKPAIDLFVVDIKMKEEKNVYEIRGKIFTLDKLKNALKGTTRDLTVFLRLDSNKITIKDLMPILFVLKDLEMPEVVLLVNSSLDDKQNTIIHIPIHLREIKKNQSSTVPLPKIPLKPVIPKTN